MSDIVTIRYRDEHEDLWNQFVKNAKNSLFLFDRQYMDYHRDRFTDHSLMFYSDDDLIAVLPACETGDELVSHGGLTYGGFLIDSRMKQHNMIECIAGLVAYAGEKGIKKLLYKPIPHIFHQQPAEEDLYALKHCGAELTEVSASTVVDLSSPLKMPKGRKAQISRAKREKVEVCVLEEKKDYEAFIQLENEVLEKRHGVRAVHTADELFLLHSRFPGNIHLFAAQKDGKMIAGTVVFEYEQAIHTQYMASNDEGRNIGALDLAVYTVMERYRSTKRWLDFGISTEQHGEILNEGLIAQKEGFGGRTNIYMRWDLQIQD